LCLRIANKKLAFLIVSSLFIFKVNASCDPGIKSAIITAPSITDKTYFIGAAKVSITIPNF